MLDKAYILTCKYSSVDRVVMRTFSSTFLSSAFMSTVGGDASVSDVSPLVSLLLRLCRTIG